MTTSPPGPRVADDGLTAGAVARQLGVAVTTLRTWHQRYDLGPSGHEPGRHRRYTPADVARLELMQRLTADGVPPGEAARWARRRPAVADLAPPRPGVSGRRDGGRLLSVRGAPPATRGLARAALRLDGDAVHRIAANAIRELGVIDGWDLVLRPVLAAIGERHARTGRLIEVEHLVSACVSDVLGAVPRRPRSARGVLLTCTDEEQHSLPLEALAAALAGERIRCRMLGARVPPQALAEAVRRTGPAAVLLWSHRPETASVTQLTALSGHPSRPPVLAACGPGWAPELLPPGVVQPRSLGEAVAMLRELLATI